MTEPWSDSDHPWDDERATVAYGPPRPAPPARPTAPSRSRRLTPLLATVPMLVVGAVVWASTDDGGARSDGAAESAAAVRCPPPDSATSVPWVQIVAVADEPCPLTATYDRRTATVELGDRGRYLLGEPGDLLLVGDWDCDGTPTPALYRPTDGRVFRFAAWADEATVTSADAEVAAPKGRAAVVRRGGCDHIEVSPRGS